MRIKTALLTMMILLVVCFTEGITLGQQRRNRSRDTTTSQASAQTEASTQTAVTQDGRRVILKSDGTWEYVNGTPNAKAQAINKQKGSLSIEAGLVFQSGDVKPVARTTFYLLDADLAQILREAGITPPDKPSNNSEATDNDFIVSFAFANRYATLEKYQAFLLAATAAIKPHIIQSITTDFTGKAVFESVPEGAYYLVGVATPAKAIVAWNLKVTVKAGQTSITLDQNNAAVAT